MDGNDLPREYDKKKYRGLALVFNIREFDIGNAKFSRTANAASTEYIRVTMGLQALNYTYLLIKKEGAPQDKARDGWVTKKYILNVLHKAAKLECLEDAESLMVVFMSYGDQGMVYASDGLLSREDLVKPFQGNQSKVLLGKPKMFIIRTLKYTTSKTYADGPDDGFQYVIPAEADFHIFWCNMPEGKYSYKGDSKQGDLFGKALSEEMLKVGKKITKTKDITDTEPFDWVGIYERVTREIARHFANYYPGELDKHTKILPLEEDSLTRAYMLTHMPKDDKIPKPEDILEHST